EAVTCHDAVRRGPLGGQRGLAADRLLMGQQPELHEGARVEEQVQPLANGELGLQVLPRDPLRPAHLQVAAPALAQLLDVIGPILVAHDCLDCRCRVAHRPTAADQRGDTWAVEMGTLEVWRRTMDSRGSAIAGKPATCWGEGWPL